MNNETSIIIDDDEDDVDLIDDSLLAEFDTSGFKEVIVSKEQNSSSNKLNDPDSSELNVSALCCNEEFSGFDKITGKKWIYPNNYPVRDYQFNIIKAAILKNTLVSLPTGLGKTFIAAVLMYNFYRWYPLGKIVFTAPTKPLIAQQIDACYKINALPQEDTIEMTGDMNVDLRKKNWATKRVFFATPQVVSNDIKSGICPGRKIRCLVIDEAHKAKKNYAYCHIVSTLTDMGHRTYRILALSATPGSRIDDVVQVVKNLLIAHLELRTENCIDVSPYCHKRIFDTVVVPLGPELTELRQKYIEVLDSYTRKLIQLNILKSNPGNISKGRILMLYREFQSNSRSHPQHGYIMHDLTRLISLYHALELLVSHGSRAFLKFFEEHTSKTWIDADVRLVAILTDLKQSLGVDPLTLNTSIQPDGTIPPIPKDLCFGHPKYNKVKEIMVDHFKRAQERNQDTRAIVFCEYHDTVNLVQCLLLQCRPLIKPRTFVGQGAGKAGRGAMSRTQQLDVMRRFRAGECTALVATCVAEEGLDVGSVDLIVCFDVATRSPVRLVQRCGRTGRERPGQVYFLVTEGKEHQTLLEGMRQRDSLKTKILHSKEVQQSLYTLNPRLIPYDMTPQCEKMFITVKKPVTSTEKCLQQKNAKTNKNTSKKQSLQNGEPLDSLNSPKKKRKDDLTALSSPKKEFKKSNLSSRCLNESPGKTNQREKSKQPLAKSSMKNADIRALFISANKSKQGCVKVANEILSQNLQMSTQSLDLFYDLAIQAKIPNTCYLCGINCNCQNIHKMWRRLKKNKSKITTYISECTFPDIDLINTFNAESILKFATHSVTNAEDFNGDENNEDDIHNDSFFPSQCYGQDVARTDIKDEAIVLPHNFDIGGVDDIFDLSPREEEANRRNEMKHSDITIPSINFDLGSFDDFLEETTKNDVLNPSQNRKECNKTEPSCNDTSICTIDLSLDDFKPVKKCESKQVKSPSLLSGTCVSGTISPILTSSLSRKTKLKRRSANTTNSPASAVNARKKLYHETEAIPNTSSSMLSITQTIDLINRTCDDSQSAVLAERDRSMSPILLTQADKKNMLKNNSASNSSITDTGNSADISIHRVTTSTSSVAKRKVEDERTASPYFHKKPKLQDQNQKVPNTIQDKIFAVLTSNDLNVEKKFQNNVINLNCSIVVPELEVKENKAPSRTIRANDTKNSNLFDKFSYTPKKSQVMSPILKQDILYYEPKKKCNGKVLKRKKLKNSFIELEAELSEDEFAGSADELTDSSEGSIADFITDKDVTPTDEDMEGHYLKSVKSPIKPGAFKIPQLPKQFKAEIIYSQFVEQDSYEMDSFCVDSHIGLTQANELSNLELAEMILEEKRRRKKKSRSEKSRAPENDDNSIIIRKAKNVKRHNVISDSEDSS